MRVLHLSDTHGTFPKLPKTAELILHTGDFCPNFIVTDRVTEGELQADWLRRKYYTMRKWLDDRSMLVVQGNHDFTNIQGVGIEDITNRKFEVEGWSFYGLPWVPAFGPWNWGASPEGLTKAMYHVPNVDVLLAHAPPYGVLDKCTGGHIGNAALLGDLHRFKYVLCGHVHEQGGGLVMRGETTIMNNATTMREFVLPTDKKQMGLF